MASKQTKRKIKRKWGWVWGREEDERGGRGEREETGGRGEREEMSGREGKEEEREAKGG